MEIKLPTHTLLAEAVSSGFTFTLLDQANVGMHTPCQCKDYFQDLFWAEHVGESTRVYGFEWKPGRVDPKAKSFNMALSYSEDLRPRVAAIAEFVNQFDMAQGFDLTEVVESSNPKILRVTLDGRWTQSAPMMSAWTTLIRLGMTYPLGSGAEAFLDHFMDMIKALPNAYTELPTDPLISPMNQMDVRRLRTTGPRLKKLLAGYTPKHSYSALRSGDAAHCFGIEGSSETLWK